MVDPGSRKTTTAAEIAFRHCLTVKDTEPHWFGDRSFGEALQLIFTSRDYILQQALSQMREPGNRIAKLVERVVRISPNTAAFRVGYVHQLFTASGLKPEQIEVLVSNELYWAMITDPKFSPRMLGRLFEELASVQKDEIEQFVLQNLSEPKNLWRKAFEDLSDEAKALTLIAGLTTSYNNETSLREAFFKFYFEKHNTHSSAQAFENALLEQSLCSSPQRANLTKLG